MGISNAVGIMGKAALPCKLSHDTEYSRLGITHLIYTSPESDPCLFVFAEVTAVFYFVVVRNIALPYFNKDHSNEKEILFFHYYFLI